jgi:hypothetical protein
VEIIVLPGVRGKNGLVTAAVKLAGSMTGWYEGPGPKIGSGVQVAAAVAEEDHIPVATMDKARAASHGRDRTIMLSPVLK